PWPLHAHLSVISLSRLDQGQVAAFVRRVAGDRPLPPALVEQIVARTDGVPLFVEELSKAVLGSALVEERDGHYELTAPLPALAIPETLQDSLMARLDRLSGVKEVAQLGAVLGREFDYEILHAVSRLDEGALQQSLVQLVEAGLIYQRGLPPAASYVFKHALIQDAAYQSLLRSRRQEYHRQIARVLEERFPEAVETQPELLAHHYTEAGLIEEAVGWWQRAGERAVARSANAEAVAHPERGLALISALPESTDRDRRELGLRVVLAACLMALKGFTAPEIAAIHARARVLCERLDDTPILVWVLCGMFSYETVSGRLRVARSPAEQCLQSALASADPHLAVAGHLPLGASQHYMGEQAAACAQFKRVLALFDPARDASYMVTIGFDLGVLAGLFLAFVWWLRGYPDQAVATRDQAVARGRELNHAYSFGYALYSDARLSGLRGEWQRAEEIAEECIAFSSTNNLPSWVAYGRLIRGWSLTERGRREEGIEQMRAAMGHWHSLGSALHIPDFSSLLAGALLRAGQMAEARELLEQALRVIETSGETMDEAELYRLRGEVLLATDLSAAEGDFLKAIDIARAQEVKSLELRASTSLARLWQGQGKRKEAQMMLAAIYGWFTEGFGTADLLDAKALLETLTIV
ncbi:MAG: ATP-binding protein, partial [Dehalococcoidia bacterium]